MEKIALITGVLGQDGTYLADLLIKKNYKVVGVSKNILNKKKWRVKSLGLEKKIILESLDINDSQNIEKLFKKYDFSEVYNFAAKSKVSKSFTNPIETTNENIFSALKILEKIKQTRKKIKFYQASSSEMFGNISDKVMSNEISFNPESPYAISKLFGHYITSYYRKSYDMFAISGILFNHESPLRSHDFIIKKIIVGLINIINKKQKYIEVGNIYSKRDWGYAKEYVVHIWNMMQSKKPKDFIIATGKSYSIKEFINIAVKYMNLDTKWIGNKFNEKLINRKNKKILIKINKKLFRPAEIQDSHIKFKKIKEIKVIKSNTKFKDLIKLMIDQEIKNSL